MRHRIPLFRLRTLINREDVFVLLADGDWGAGGCWILAEALYRHMSPGAELLAIEFPASGTHPRIQVAHVIVRWGDMHIDYNGIQTEREVLHQACAGTNHSLARLVAFTQSRQRWAIRHGIPYDARTVKELHKVLDRELE